MLMTPLDTLPPCFGIKSAISGQVGSWLVSGEGTMASTLVGSCYVQMFCQAQHPYQFLKTCRPKRGQVNLHFPDEGSRDAANPSHTAGTCKPHNLSSSWSDPEIMRHVKLHGQNCSFFQWDARLYRLQPLQLGLMCIRLLSVTGLHNEHHS
jgi:hypothetical protein